MSTVTFWVLLGYILLNLLGEGLYHYQYAHETHKVVWYKDKTFWIWTVYILFLGVAYDGIRLVEYILNKIRSRK